MHIKYQIVVNPRFGWLETDNLLDHHGIGTIDGKRADEPTFTGREKETKN